MSVWSLQNIDYHVLFPKVVRCPSVPSLPMATVDIKNPEISLNRFSNSQVNNLMHSSFPRREKKNKGGKKKRLTKADIGTPSNFQWVTCTFTSVSTPFPYETLVQIAGQHRDVCNPRSTFSIIQSYTVRNPTALAFIYQEICILEMCQRRCLWIWVSECHIFNHCRLISSHLAYCSLTGTLATWGGTQTQASM